MTVEDFLGFLFMLLVIISSISKNKKKKQQAQARKQVRQEIASKQQNRAPYSMEALQAWFEEDEEGGNQPAETAWKPENPAPKVAAAAGMGEKTHEGLHPCDEHTAAPAQVAQPRIQARVQVTEKPNVVMGSMGVDSHEGMHPCDVHEEEPLAAGGDLIPQQLEKPGLQLDWTGENMVKAFIMQEILTRPSQRRA